MRYFSYTKNNVIKTVSEQEIFKNYYNIWYIQMCEKYEQSYVDEYYCFADCLEHWVILNKAWESTI